MHTLPPKTLAHLRQSLETSAINPTADTTKSDGVTLISAEEIRNSLPCTLARAIFNDLVYLCDLVYYDIMKWRQIIVMMAFCFWDAMWLF